MGRRRLITLAGSTIPGIKIALETVYTNMILYFTFAYFLGKIFCRLFHPVELPILQRYTDEPFTSYMPEALFNISRYLMHELLSEQPKGVSKFAVHYALAKQGRYSVL